MPDVMRFPHHTGVPFQPGPPTVDGFAEPEPAMSYDFGTAPAQVDTGWAGAARQTFGDATSGGLGSPLAALLGVKDSTQDYLYLSVVVRRDPDFDDADRVVLVLHPDFAAGSTAKTGEERRIDIEPVSSGAGAGTAAPNEPDPWGLTVAGAGFKAARPPRNVEHYAWDLGTAGWTPTPAPTGVHVRVRSWDGGTNNRNWSLEVRIPTSTATGGPGWIDLTDSIGFYVDVIRASSGTPAGLDFVTQFVWPAGGELDDDGGLLDIDQVEIEPAKLGQVVLGSTAPGPAVRGVSFDGGYGSVGARPPGSSVPPGSAISAGANQFVARVLNDDTTAAAGNVTAEFRIANWGLGPGHFAKWNTLTPDTGHTNPTPPASLPPAGTSGSAVAPSRAELTTQWTPPAGLYGTTLHVHQCIWVRLESNQTVSFVKSSTVRNMDVVPLSGYEREAEVSGVGYPEEDGGDLRFLLLTSHVAVSRRVTLGSDAPQGRRGSDDQPVDDGAAVTEAVLAHRQAAAELHGYGAALPVDDRLRGHEGYEQVFVTVVDGYRRTPRTLTIRGRRYDVYAYADSYGHTGVHRGPTLEALDVALHGDVREVAAGSYLLSVPRDGAARVMTSLRTRPQKDPDDGRPVRRPGRRRPWWRRLVGRLLGTLRPERG